MSSVKYNNKKFRITVAFAASVIIIIFGTRFDVYRALTTPGFYFVLAMSFVIALLLVQFVHYVTIRLDKDYDWRTKLPERIVAQLLFGVLIPLLIDMAVYYVYFAMIGQSIFENGYFHIDIPFIALLLLLLNFYYCLHYFVLTDKYSLSRKLKSVSPANGLPASGNDRQLLTVICPDLDDSIRLETDVIYFYSINKQIFMVLSSGKELPVSSTLQILGKALNGVGFSQINRSVVLNLNTVLHYKIGTKRDTLTIIFKDAYEPVFKQQNGDYFAVTKNYIKPFLKFLDQITPDTT